MEKPPYKAIGFAVIVTAILLAAILAYKTVDTVTEIIEDDDDDNDNGSTPNIIVYGPGYKRHLLLGDSTDTIHVEVDYVEGFHPTNGSLDVLRSKMVEITGKQVTLSVDDEIPLNDTDYSRKDVEALEAEYRDTLEQDGNAASVYIMYLNGMYDSSDGTLGLSYNGTSALVMKERLDDIDIPRVLERAGLTTQDFEISVAIHEMGHLFGMVNINYTSAKPHEDTSYPHHCIYDNCVMYWALEASPSGYMQNLINSGRFEPPTDFCDDCLFDIMNIKTGEY